MHLRFAAAAILFVSILVTSAAQERPNLSGTWVATTDAPQAIAAAPSPVFGPRFGIQQDAASVALTRVAREGSFLLTLPLDGTEVRWRVPGRLCEGESERTEKVAIEGAELVFTLVGMTPPGGGASRFS